MLLNSLNAVSFQSALHHYALLEALLCSPDEKESKEKVLIPDMRASFMGLYDELTVAPHQKKVSFLGKKL